MSENKHENVYKSRKQIITNNFLGGLAWGIGVTIGLSVFFAVLAFIAGHINFVPIIGDFVANVINYVLNSGDRLPR